MPNKYCERPVNTSGGGQDATSSTDVGGTRWLTVLAAPLRVHRYRDAHTRLLREALCRQDCAK